MTGRVAWLVVLGQLAVAVGHADPAALRERCLHSGRSSVDSTPPGATIRVDDGPVVGTTPAKRLAIRVGDRTLTVEKPGFESQSRRIHVHASGIDHASFTTLYRCSRGVPTFSARCSDGCSPHYSEGGECVGLGLCRDGGTYCGGHVLDGDPNTLYVCRSLDPTDPTLCPRGCQVRGDGDDACK
jgi:hypothetical protein